MAAPLIGECPKCRTNRRMVAFFGSFRWTCSCPPPRVFYSHNTAPIPKEAP